MYTLSTCPWCRKTKQFFRDSNIPFDYVDYDLQGEEEQEKIIDEMTVESRKKALRYLFQKIVDTLGYKFSPDEEMVDFLLEQEVMLEQKHGIPIVHVRDSLRNGRKI
ncbi:MAG: glutaredoxin family protein [Candidatus Methanoperedens sp.]|nr:glutaredoxin family protein [Candidatus Methanoperedens sp.]CAG1001549.1 hypothetical protein METP1_02931 [Methanosarcinales archaeon]